METLEVEICNSWILDPVRSYSSTVEISRIYHNMILAEVFRQFSNQSFLEIFFVDNQFSNLIYLNLTELKKELNLKFQQVKFFSDNPLDCTTKEIEYKISESTYITDKNFVLSTKKMEILCTSPIKKFGICIQRPDQHRFSLLMELLNYNNLDLFSRIGFDKNTLDVVDYWRQGCGDQILRYYNLTYREFCSKLELYTRSELTDFLNPCVPGHELKNLDQNLNNIKFCLDIVAESHVSDNVFIPSEKTLRPIMLKQPFIIFSSNNFYKNLHSLGLQTFNDLWDESWDCLDQKSMFDKAKKIASTIDYINQKYSIADLLEKTKEIREHNYNRCLELYQDTDTWLNSTVKVMYG